MRPPLLQKFKHACPTNEKAQRIRELANADVMSVGDHLDIYQCVDGLWVLLEGAAPPPDPVNVDPVKPLRFNINETIRFRPTEKGKEVYREHWARFGMSGRELKLDADGWATMNMWGWAEIFGQHFGMTVPLVTETTIELIPS